MSSRPHLSIPAILTAHGRGPQALGSDADIVVEGLPPEAGVRWIAWRPSGGAVAFVVRPEKSSEQLELWYAEFDASRPAKGQKCVARPLIQDRTLAAVLGSPHRWTVDDRLLIKPRNQLVALRLPFVLMKRLPASTSVRPLADECDVTAIAVPESHQAPSSRVRPSPG